MTTETTTATVTYEAYGRSYDVVGNVKSRDGKIVIDLPYTHGKSLYAGKTAIVDGKETTCLSVYKAPTKLNEKRSLVSFAL